MTEEEFKALVAQAQARYDNLSPQAKVEHDYAQRRSFVKGMCPSNRDYDEWCKLVDQLIP